MPRCGLLVLLLVSFPVRAGAIDSASVAVRDGVYILNLDALIDAPRSRVLALATDYAHLSRLSDAITRSSLIWNHGPHDERRRMVLHTCILIFCFKAVLVEDVNETSPGTIVTTVVPSQSDFSAGRSVWRFTAAPHDETRVRVHITKKPSFWIPPIIGPWLAKRAMMSQTLKIIDRMETLAGDHPHG